jgi:signal transduction histidine kinase
MGQTRESPGGAPAEVRGGWRWPRAATAAVLLAAWAALAAWQYHEYGHECSAAQDTLRSHAGAVMSALTGGIGSHRRQGPFFDEQVQGVLEDLTRSPDVRAAAVTGRAGRPLLSAGRADLLAGAPLGEPGGALRPEGFLLVADLPVAPPAPAAGRPPGWGRWAGQGRGPRGPGPDEGSVFAAGGPFTAALLLDRTGADDAARRAAWSRLSVVAAGTLVLVCVGLIWRATVRLAAARGALDAEARHLQNLGQAAAGLAHETRNPLGLIRGWTQRLAASTQATAGQRQQAQAVIEECDRVTARINQFLTFARPCRPRPEALDLWALVEELALLLEPDLETRGLTLRRALPANGAPARADRELLRQALFNLLQNAVQWSPAGDAVEVNAGRAAGGGWRVEVADRGPGVAAGAVASLFTPYFTTRHDGTGLGLAIVWRIAGAHGWRAGYTPRPGGGSVFWLDGIHG